MLIICTCSLCGCVKKEAPTTVKFASWGSKSEIDILKPIISDFEKEYPNIKVEFIHIPQNYFQKIHLLFASNTAPDVIFINNLYLPVYANAGLLRELTVEDRNVYFENSLRTLSYKGKLYAVPRDISNLVIYYNKDIFDKKNVPYPESSWTFSDFLRTAEALTDEETFAISFEEDPLFYLPFLMSEEIGRAHV